MEFTYVTYLPPGLAYDSEQREIREGFLKQAYSQQAIGNDDDDDDVLRLRHKNSSGESPFGTDSQQSEINRALLEMQRLGQKVNNL